VATGWDTQFTRLVGCSVPIQQAGFGSSLNVELCPSMTGSATSFARMSKTIAAIAPISPQIIPSSMNGPRTNQFDAPTSFITSTSRRLEKIERRMVFAIRIVEAIIKITDPSRKMYLITFVTERIRSVFFCA